MCDYINTRLTFTNASLACNFWKAHSYCYKRAYNNCVKYKNELKYNNNCVFKSMDHFVWADQRK